MAEQVSVLSSQKEINAAEMLRFMPDGKLDSLPALINAPGSKQQFTNEREMMYQVLFDMKKDVNDLKKAFSNILQGQPLPTDSVENDFFDQAVSSNSSYSNNTTAVSNNPVVQAINPNQPLVLQQSAEIEESLNIADREKELIIKALKKHKSRRRNAATELGISERTLYRKVKEYNLENL